ncbi:MAG: alpha/beta hydrolase [bacterium]|nr:alpha/beta hydrolase [bacterium]
MLKLIKRIVISVIAGLLIAIVLVIAFQEAVLFPGVYVSTRSLDGDPAVFPDNAEKFFLQTADGNKVEVWRMPGDETGPLADRGYVAAVFHGNGGSLEYFTYLQQFFASLGVTSYAMDYRGYGRSTGWPKEQAVLSDVDELWLTIRDREAITPQDLLVLGYSIGTGPASYLAAQLHPAALMLIAPYASIPKLLETHEFWGEYAFIFRWALRSNFDTEGWVSKLMDTALFITHGTDDRIIQELHSHIVEGAYHGSGKLQAIYVDGAGHGDIFWQTKGELAKFITGLQSRR